MNPSWYGDSFDLVKRFFVSALKNTGFSVEIAPMLTGDWDADSLCSFYNLLGGVERETNKQSTTKRALLVDPDTGIGPKAGAKHTTIGNVVKYASEYIIVIVFDQSFSRNKDPASVMDQKLFELGKHGTYGFYYDSHARFLVCSNDPNALNDYKRSLVPQGLPLNRLRTPDAIDAAFGSMSEHPLDSASIREDTNKSARI